MENSPIIEFEKRKREHIELSLADANEAMGLSGLDSIGLVHEALPEINFSDIKLQHKSLGEVLETPFLVSSMTAGHIDSVDLNQRLAKACQSRGWMMGVGSQRRELFDAKASNEWAKLRKAAPRVKLIGNIGLSQLIHSSVDSIKSLVAALQASALFVHTNPLQEALQPEGTPEFKGGLKALSQLCQQLNVPVVLKETGCGFSVATLQRLKETGLKAVDVSGFGGTHWGRIEGARAQASGSKSALIKAQAAKTFSHWGVSTVQSVSNALELNPDYEVWASGGVRTGLDAAKLFAMGANKVGFAKPILQAALAGEEALDVKMEVLEFELKTALFCTGAESIGALQSKKAWVWTKK